MIDLRDSDEQSTSAGYLVMRDAAVTTTRSNILASVWLHYRVNFWSCQDAEATKQKESQAQDAEVVISSSYIGNSRGREIKRLQMQENAGSYARSNFTPEPSGGCLGLELR